MRVEAGVVAAETLFEEEEARALRCGYGSVGGGFVSEVAAGIGAGACSLELAADAREVNEGSSEGGVLRTLVWDVRPF